MSSGQADLFARDDAERKALSESQRATIRSRLETTLVKLEAAASFPWRDPATLLPLISDFLRWSPIPPKRAKMLANVSARLCRLLRDELVERMGPGHSGGG